MFGRKKGPDKPFQHAEDCRIWKTDPGVQIPWSEIRLGVWEAVCVCGKQYQHDPVVDDRVRNDPLKIGHRGAPQCELHRETDPAVLRLALKAIDKGDYSWVQCSACDTAGRFRTTPRASGNDDPPPRRAPTRGVRSLCPGKGRERGSSEGLRPPTAVP